MRGKPKIYERIEPTARITPAHAGKTCFFCSIPQYSGDHPRACGENSMRLLYPKAKQGSPPRMRGKPGTAAPRKSGGRITPAHAGKTKNRCFKIFSAGDHPRACGENLSTVLKAKQTSGSPPRMRGKLQKRTKRGKNCGITPAHAGKTVHLDSIKDDAADHPRACGENQMLITAATVSTGSPPRMRGKPFLS